MKKIEKVMKHDCEEMRIKLNKIFPYPTECLTFEELDYLDTFFFVMQEKLDPQSQAELLKIYNRIFNQHKPPTSCTPCWISILEELKVAHNQYKI